MRKIIALLLLFIFFSYVSGVERADFNMVATNKKTLDSTKKGDRLQESPQRFSEKNSIVINGWNFDTVTKVWWRTVNSAK